MKSAPVVAGPLGALTDEVTLLRQLVWVDNAAATLSAARIFTIQIVKSEVLRR